MKLQDYARYIVLGGIFVLPFVPFMVTSSMFFPFITGKNFTFRIIVELMFAAWLILILLDTQYRPRFSWILGTFAAFIGAIFIADLMSENVFKSFWSNFERMEGFVTLAHLFVYFVMTTTVLATDKLWTALMNVTVGASTIMGFIGLNEISDYYFRGEGSYRIDATLGNPTYLAIYAVFHIFIIGVLMVRHTGSKYVKYIYGLVALLNVVVLFYTATRGSILGFIGGAILTALFIAVFERDNQKLKKAAIGALVIIGLIIGGFWMAKDSDLIQGNKVLKRFANISLDAGTAGSRFMIWDMAWQGVKERPIFGWGQESFNFVFNKHLNPEMYKHEPWFDRTHNIVFDWLIAGGFVGAIAYFSIPLAIMYSLWWWRRNDHPMSVIERALWTGLLAAYFFHNLFVFDNLVSYLLYMLLLGYIHYRITRDEKPLFGDFKIDPSNVKMIVAPVLIVLVVTFIYFANLRGLYTAGYLVEALRQLEAVARNQNPNPQRVLDLYDKALAYDFIGRQEGREQFLQTASRVSRFSDANIKPELKQTIITRAKDAMDEQLAIVPNDTRTLLFMGSFLGGQGRPDEALEYLEKAHELSPTKQIILFEIGSRKSGKGDHEGAFEAFKEAYDLAPENDEARKLYALSAIYVEDLDLAADLLEEEGTLAVDDTRFLRAYDSLGMHEQVIEILKKRVEKNPDNAQTYVSLAAGYLKAGDQAAAIADIRKGIEADPNFKAQGEKFINDIESGTVSLE